MSVAASNFVETLLGFFSSAQAVLIESQSFYSFSKTQSECEQPLRHYELLKLDVRIVLPHPHHLEEQWSNDQSSY